MADPRAFISFDFDHNETSKNLFVGQSANSSTPFTIEDWSLKQSFGQTVWKDKARAQLRRSNLAIVLVGKQMGSATGVAAELAIAADEDVPAFGVYVDGANKNSTLPTGLARNRTISWDWADIANAIDQMMNEKKNV